MTFEQRKFSLVPDKLRPISNDLPPEEARRPMTSKQAKKLYLERNRGPRLTKQQQRQRERELQAEIRREIEEKEKVERQEKDRVRQQAKAKVIREKKKAKEDAEKEAKRKAGLPLSTCRPSQDTIARFFRPNRVEKRSSVEQDMPRIPNPKEEPDTKEPPGRNQSNASQHDTETSPPEVSGSREEKESERIIDTTTKSQHLPVIEEEHETVEEQVGGGIRHDSIFEAPCSPPRKRMRLEDEASETSLHPSQPPPLIIARTPSPQPTLSRQSKSPAIAPADSVAPLEGTPLTTSNPDVLEDDARSVVEAPPSPPPRPTLVGSPTRPHVEQMNPRGFIRASALHTAAKKSAAPRFVRPQHPSTYKTCHPGASNGSRKFLPPAQTISACATSPSVPPPSSMLAFIADNIDDFFGGSSQFAPDNQSRKQIELEGSRAQEETLPHFSETKPQDVNVQQPDSTVRSVGIVSPATDVLQDFGDLDSLFPSGTQIQRELLEDQDGVGAREARSGIRSNNVRTQDTNGKKVHVGGREPRIPWQTHLTSDGAGGVESVPFFCSQDFNLSPQDVQEIEAPAVPPSEPRSATSRRQVAASYVRKPAAARPKPSGPRQPTVQDSLVAGRTGQAAAGSKRSSGDAIGLAHTHKAKDPTLRSNLPKASARIQQSAADPMTTTKMSGALQPISNPPGPSRPLQDTVSSQDLAAMMEADWDDDCLPAKQQQQRDDLDEPRDLWDAISSQDLRAVFAEDWGGTGA